MLIKSFDDVEQRIREDEFNYLLRKYPHIGFNVRTWTGVPNDRRHGKRYLYATEGFITMPENYDVQNIRQYDGYLTCNSKFKELHPELNVIVTNGPLRTGNYWALEHFRAYDQKVKGVAAMLKNYATGREGDILHMRHVVMNDLGKEFSQTGAMVAHSFGPTPFGWPAGYQGNLNLGAGSQNHERNLQKLNEYLFCFCPEPMYHQLWSWDWLTERILNCFKAKTVPIYYGCYNVEQHVPKHLFIDYREFNGDHRKLADYLLNFPRDRYESMIEEAFLWEQKCRTGNMHDLETMLGGLP